MITLYGFGTRLGLPDISPFVLKVDAFLRLNNLEYQRKNGLPYLRNSPKGKLPVIDDNGKTIPDSSFIIEHLTTSHQLTLDDWLTPEQKATAYLISKSIDENFYWCLIYSRWISESSWSRLKVELFTRVPFPLRLIVPHVVRNKVKKSLFQHGMGRHSDSEIHEIARKSLQSFSDILGEKTFIFGDKPCSLDATLYGFLAQAILIDMDTPMTQLARGFPTLVSYCERFQQEYYPEFSAS